MNESSTFLFCLLTACSLGFATAEASDQPHGKSPALPPRERILDCVKHATGLDALFSIEKIDLTSLHGSGLPFSAEIKSQTGIRVRFIPGKFKWKLPIRGADDPYVRQFTVYLNADANQVLAVTSRLAERSPDIPAEPSPDTDATQLPVDHDVYDSFPTVDPKFTFVEALEVVREYGIGYPLLAHEFDGFYVIYSPKNEKPHPVWIIKMRGLPPMPISHLPSDDGNNEIVKSPRRQGRSYYRYYVDAISGKWMFGGISSWSKQTRPSSCMVKELKPSCARRP
jgi:hypothetical protein